MFKVTRFCVVPYERKGSELVRGDAMQFHTEGEALEAARRARKRCGKVDVYQVTGWPVQNLWDRPRKVG